MKRERGPHEVQAEILLTVSYQVASAASPMEAENQIEDQIAKSIPKAFIGGKVVEHEILEIVAEPTAELMEEDELEEDYDW